MKLDRFNRSGFTIVETLIVLTVTSALFIIGVTIINGRQSKTEYQTGINNFQQQIRQVINATVSGYYPHSLGYLCNGANANQGSNYGCVFLGKVVHLGSTSGNGKDMTIYSITGKQSATTIARSLAEALPIDSVIKEKLPNSLVVASMTYDSVAGRVNIPTAAVAFLSGDSVGTLGTNDLNGGQQFSLYAIKNTTTSTTDDASMSSLLNHTYRNLDAASRVQICIASDTIDQSGLITIGTSSGGSNGGLTVNLKLHSGVICA